MSKRDVSLDEKDRKILAELDKNARTTDSEIAKRIRLSKQVVHYRIKNLMQREIVTSFYTAVDVGKLGYDSYYVYLQLAQISEEEECTLLNKIQRLPFVGWLVSGTGRWDAVALLYAPSPLAFDRALAQLLELCSPHVNEYTFTQLLRAEHIGYRIVEQKDRRSVRQSEKSAALHLDEVDKKILLELSQNARMSVVELAEKIPAPLHVAHYHLKTLQKRHIIEAFKPKIDIGKLGYQWHLLLVQFAPINEARKKQCIEFCRAHPSVYYVTNTIGNYNLMLDIHVRSTEEFRKVLWELKKEFSDVMSVYESLIIFDEYKIDYFTELFA